MSSTKIYWENPLENRFTATVMACSKKDNEYEIVIDQECIRPEGGGQAGDRGLIEYSKRKRPFSNTLLRNNQVAIISDFEIPVGESIALEIDMIWRRGMMRNHTAEHLFVSSLIQKNPESRLGYIWIDGVRGTVEILGDSVNFEKIVEAEKKVQEIIHMDIPVESRLVDSLDLDVDVRAREGVSKHETFRIISITGFDHSACSGTHVLNTGDIGMFKIIDYKVTKEGTRLEFATSNTAIGLTTQLYNMALERKHEYPFELIQLGPVLDKSKKLINDKQELLSEIMHILRDGIKIEEINSVSFRAHYLPGFSSQELRLAMKSLLHDEKSITLLFTPGLKSNFIIWVTGLDAGDMDSIRDIVFTLGGKGGGSGSAFTGGFSELHQGREKFDELSNAIQAWLSN